jgi:DNA-binding MurR/RpiR family transcriptional regulator
MQRIFRARLVERTPRYRDRIRRLQAGANHGLDSPEGILDHFVEAGINALKNLREEVSQEKLDQALWLLRKARTIHIVGQRRAFSVAAYLAYGFAQLGRSCHLIDNIGGMFEQQAQEVTKGDALVAISFHPYAAETVKVADRVAQARVPIIAITDDPLSPLSPLAAVAFEVEDGQVKGFRSLTAIMALAVTLVVGLGQSLDAQGGHAAGRPRTMAKVGTDPGTDQGRSGE